MSNVRPHEQLPFNIGDRVQVNKVTIPAATKVAIGFIVFLTAPLLLLGIFDLFGLLQLIAWAVSGVAAMFLVYLIFIRISITVTRRLAFKADIWFARRRLAKNDLDDDYCLLLRSTQADAALSIDDSDGRGIRDAAALRLDVAPSFRSLLAHRMQPLYTVLIKNSAHLGDVVSVTYANAEWRSNVIDNMKSASLILLMPHWPSEALVWEMQQLQSGGHLCKTFVVMPPSYLFRPGALAQPALFDRLFDRLRYITRETLEAMAPDYFVETRHTVALEAERAEFARAGWESARAIASKIGLELPDYDPKGAVFLAAALVPPPIGATASVLDSYRITALVGALDWKSDTTGSLLLSVARGR